MKFVYLANTKDAPEKTKIHGYTFVKREPVEIKEPSVIERLEGMKHIGIIKYEDFEHRMPALVDQDDVTEEQKELRKKAKELVDSKTYDALRGFAKENGLNEGNKNLKKEDLKKLIIAFLIKNPNGINKVADQG